LRTGDVTLVGRDPGRRTGLARIEGHRVEQRAPGLGHLRRREAPVRLQRAEARVAGALAVADAGELARAVVGVVVALAVDAGRIDRAVRLPAEREGDHRRERGERVAGWRAPRLGVEDQLRVAGADRRRLATGVAAIWVKLKMACSN